MPIYHSISYIINKPEKLEQPKNIKSSFKRSTHTKCLDTQNQVLIELSKTFCHKNMKYKSLLLDKKDMI
jgi:hypothetical protein